MSEPDNDNLPVPPQIGGECSHVLDRTGEAILDALVADPEDGRGMAGAAARVLLEDIARDQNPRMIAIYARSIGIDLTAAQPGDKGA